jgi:hypothetical protein
MGVFSRYPKLLYGRCRLVFGLTPAWHNTGSAGIGSVEFTPAAARLSGFVKHLHNTQGTVQRLDF